MAQSKPSRSGAAAAQGARGAGAEDVSPKTRAPDSPRIPCRARYSTPPPHARTDLPRLRPHRAAPDRPLSERMLALAGIRPGMHILDLATGRGEPAVRAAHRVGPTGTVLGVDLSESLIEMARERATREGLSNLDLRALNA